MMVHQPNFRFPEHSKLCPFVNTGTDMFGPFHIEWSRTQKELNYVCMFTCLVTRAVHLEVCEDLSTDCLLMAIRRFVSRWGLISVFRTTGNNLLELVRQWNSIFRKTKNQTTTTYVSSWRSRTSSGRSTHLWHRTSEGFGNDLSSWLNEAYLLSSEAAD